MLFRSHADWEGTRLVAVLSGIHRVETGDPIALDFRPDDMMLFDATGRAVAAPNALAA